MNRYISVIAALIVVQLFSACGNELVITSTPTASLVKINSEDYGRTPLTLKDLKTGVYRVEVNSNGYEPWSAEVELRNSQSVNAILKQSAPPPIQPPVVTRQISQTSLTVFAEPSGAIVKVDGKERGTSKTGEGISVNYSQIPTLVEVAVTKPGFERWIRSVAMESQRDNRVFVKLNPASDWFDYVTDGEFLRKTVQQVVSATSNLPTLRRASSIAVLSITHAEGSDEPLQALVEDALISNLAQAGFTPVERDDQMLIQLAHSTSGDSIPYRVLTEHESLDAPFLYDAEIANSNTEIVRENYPIINRTQTTTTSKENCVSSTEETVSTREEEGTRAYPQTSYLTGYIPTADQFLAYRILECGLSKTPVIEGELVPEPMLHRYASVRVHLRVIDAKNGRVTWAGYLVGESKDEIPERVSEELFNPPNRLASEPLPDSWQRLRHRPQRHLNSEGMVIPSPQVRDR